MWSLRLFARFSSPVRPKTIILVAEVAEVQGGRCLFMPGAGPGKSAQVGCAAIALPLLAMAPRDVPVFPPRFEQQLVGRADVVVLDPEEDRGCPVRRIEQRVGRRAQQREQLHRRGIGNIVVAQMEFANARPAAGQILQQVHHAVVRKTVLVQLEVTRV